MYAISDRHRDEIIAMLTAFASLSEGNRRLANLLRRALLIARSLGRKRQIKDNPKNFQK